MTAVQIIFSMSAAIITEQLFRNIGLFLPFTAMMIFYFTVLYGWRFGFVLGAVTGCICDMLCGYSFPVSTLSAFFVVALAVYWLYKVESDSLMLHMVPGIILPFLVYPLSFCFAGWTMFLQLLPALILSSLVTTILLPLVILITDTISEHLYLPLYADVKIKMRYGR